MPKMTDATAIKAVYLLILATVLLMGSGAIPSVVPQAVPPAFKQGSTGTKFQIQTGTAGVGNCPTWDANGNLVDSGVATCGGAGGSVSSFNGRTGAVLPQTGDYNITQITNGGTVTSVDGTVALGVESIVSSSLAAITTSGSLRAASLVNAQSGTTYIVLTGDRAKLVTHTNGSAVAVTLPQANSSTFAPGWFYCTQNRGAGTVTITPTTSTIDGAASVSMTTNQGMCIHSDGTNYFTMRGGGGGGVSLSVANTWTAQQTFSSGNGGIPMSWRNLDFFSVNGHNGYLLGNTNERIYTWADSTACSGSNGPTFGIGLTSDCPTAVLQVRGATGISSNSSALFGVILVGQSGIQTGNNSSVTGSSGGPVTLTGGDGRGFNAGSTSVGGAGGAVTISAGVGGAANSGSTTGGGGNVSIAAGAAGGGGGTAGVAGKITITGQTVYANVSGSTTIDVGTLATGSNDMAGKVTSTTGAPYTGVITFAKTWARAPACHAQDESATNAIRATSTTTTLTLVGVSTSNDVLSYTCFGY